jgi:hypothetical protein
MNYSLFLRKSVLAGFFTLLSATVTAQTDSTSVKPLPLSVLEFTARNQEDLIVVEWTSLDEAGISHYILQYSSDGEAFKDLLQAASSKKVENAVFKYTITDYPQLRDHHYYRLQAVDLSGKREDKAFIRIGSTGSLTTIIHPNPARDTRFPSVIPTDRPAYILLCDATGKVMKQYAQKKKSSLLIPINDIKEGLHLLRVYTQP